MYNPFDLTGKVALVTGASRGLGQYFSLALATAGADLAITSRDPRSLEETKAAVEALGKKALPVALDVREEASIKAAVAQTLEHYGKIDILVNNAGMNVRKYSADITWEEFNDVINTNLRGAYFCATEVAKQAMIPRHYGRIINIASGTCIRPISTCAPYSASRGGVKQMTHAFAADWAKLGITVNAIAPGWFLTQQTRKAFEDTEWKEVVLAQIPAGHFGGEHDLDGAVVFLSSDACPYLTGHMLVVDGGYTIGDVPAPSTIAPPQHL